MNLISTITQLNDTIQRYPAILIYFYSDDCAPCISLRPKVKELIHKDFPKMELQLINSGSNPELPAKFGVFANPAILLFFDGKETRRFSKYISVDELQQAIERYYSMLFDD